MHFRGDGAATAIRSVARGACTVCLRMEIRHTHRNGPPPVYRTVFAEETAQVDGELSILALVDTVHSKHFTYRGVVLRGTVTVFAAQRAPRPGELRMRRATFGTSLPVDAAGTWDSARGVCVYDFLLHRYASMRALSREYLRSIFDAGGHDTLAVGVSTDELDAFAARHKLRVYAATPDGRVFHRRDGSSRHPPLAYVVANAHMFPVTSPDAVFHMARHGAVPDRRAARDAEAAEAVEAAEAAEAVEAAETGHDVVVAADDLEAVWVAAMRARGTVLNAGARVHGTRLVRFYCGGGSVTCNGAWADVVRVARALGVAPRPMDGVGSVARRFFHQQIPTLAHLCVVTQPVALQRGATRTAFVGALTPFDEEAALRCFDIRRCYAQQLAGNDGRAWAVTGAFDAIEPYDGRELGAGRYFVTSGAGASLPRGAGWYYERWARRAVVAGASVLLQQRARRTLAPDAFAAAIAACRERLDADDAKFVVNSFIGGLRVASRQGGRCVATTDALEARCVAGDAGLVRDLGDGLFCAMPRRGTRPPRPEKADLAFLYDQVIEGAWCALDALCARIAALSPEAVIVAVKTDAVVVRGAAFDAGALGDAYREEHEVSVPAHPLLVTHAPIEPYELAWTAPGGPSGAAPAGCLFLGMAGTGKTHEARVALAALAARGARVVAVGPTIKAAANVGGITVHALYDMREPERFADPPETTTLRAVARRYDAILVDEVFMCTAWMLETFLCLARAGVAFVLAGDPEQLPPVFTTAPAPAVVARSALVHELVGGNVRLLEAPRRSVRAMCAPGTIDVLSACRWLLAASVSRESNATFAAMFARATTPRARNLAYLNATCARVNAERVLARRRGRVWLVGAECCPGVWPLRRALAALDGRGVFATGAPVLARGATYGRRGARWTVAAIDADAATVGTSRVPLDDVGRAFELAFCVTIHRSQCETIDEPYVVHDLDRILALPARAARALLYVAVSRATSAALVAFA